RRNWFMLSQTDGQPYQMPAIPAWDRARALQTLNVEEIPLETLNGNCQGYAKDRQIAINPLAQMPAKTTFYELAHVELRYTTEAIHDSENTPRNLREVEAESVALPGIARHGWCRLLPRLHPELAAWWGDSGAGIERQSRGDAE